jgi:hypothetical protein
MHSVLASKISVTPVQLELAHQPTIDALKGSLKTALT